MRRSLLVLLPGLGALAIAAACTQTEQYVYSAQKYDPVGCVAAYAPLDTVSGKGANSFCAPTCMTVGKDTYVSTMCPPLPGIAVELEADAGDCVAARRAAASGGTCDEPADDGGAPESGGPDVEQPDSGPDAPSADGAADGAITDAAKAG